MMYETNTPESELARLLAGLPTISQLDVALKAGGLPMNSESRKMIGVGLARIKCTQSAQEGVKPETIKMLKALADVADGFVRIFQTDAGRQAVSIIEEQAIWDPRIEVTKHQEAFSKILEAATLYYHLYSRSTSRVRGRENHENRMLSELYCLYREIKIAAGDRLGIAGPLYRFTKECVGLLGQHLSISEPAFRMRIQRLKSKRFEGIGSQASVL
jgi:hypothetical protein